MTEEEKWMKLAIEEAKKGEGKTFPNPLVGAVIVDEGVEVARGYHEKAGCDHAEIVALKKLENVISENAQLYVTLEPCSTEGRTPACTDAIIRSGIRRVFVGAIDPNPKHCGRGLEILRRHGIKIKSSILEKECEALNLEFNQRMKNNKD